jgi:DNA-binding transcriptional LysR family regulator
VIFLMDVKQLRQFVMVMRYGSITTAARKLRIA